MALDFVAGCLGGEKLGFSFGLFWNYSEETLIRGVLWAIFQSRHFADNGSSRKVKEQEFIFISFLQIDRVCWPSRWSSIRHR
jgi:hypothetical protein